MYLVTSEINHLPPPKKGEVESRSDSGGGVKRKRRRIPLEITKKVRALRNNLTEAEKKLWYFLRQRYIGGCKFRRQYPLGKYIADFACIERKLIIEVDGGQHTTQKTETYDKKRTTYFEKRGFKVLRFWNHEVLGNREGVLQVIAEYLTTTPPPQSSPSEEGEEGVFLPLPGEGRHAGAQRKRTDGGTS